MGWGGLVGWWFICVGFVFGLDLGVCLIFGVVLVWVWGSGGFWFSLVVCLGVCFWVCLGFGVGVGCGCDCFGVFVFGVGLFVLWLVVFGFVGVFWVWVCLVMLLG